MNVKMAEKELQKKRIAHNVKLPNACIESKNDVAQNDYISGIMKDMDSMHDSEKMMLSFSKQQKCGKEKYFSSKLEAHNKMPFAKPTKKFLPEKRFPLMAKCQKTLNILKKNTNIPKPRAHVGKIILPTNPILNSKTDKNIFNNSTLSGASIKKTTLNSMKKSIDSKKRKIEPSTDRLHSPAIENKEKKLKATSNNPSIGISGHDKQISKPCYTMSCSIIENEIKNHKRTSCENPNTPAIRDAEEKKSKSASDNETDSDYEKFIRKHQPVPETDGYSSSSSDSFSFKKKFIRPKQTEKTKLRKKPNSSKSVPEEKSMKKRHKHKGEVTKKSKKSSNKEISRYPRQMSHSDTDEDMVNDGMGTPNYSDFSEDESNVHELQVSNTGIGNVSVKVSESTFENLTEINTSMFENSDLQRVVENPASNISAKKKLRSARHHDEILKSISDTNINQNLADGSSAGNAETCLSASVAKGADSNVNTKKKFRGAPRRVAQSNQPFTDDVNTHQNLEEIPVCTENSVTELNPVVTKTLTCNVATKKKFRSSRCRDAITNPPSTDDVNTHQNLNEITACNENPITELNAAVTQTLTSNVSTKKKFRSSRSRDAKTYPASTDNVTTYQKCVVSVNRDPVLDCSALSLAFIEKEESSNGDCSSIEPSTSEVPLPSPSLFDTGAINCPPSNTVEENSHHISPRNAEPCQTPPLSVQIVSVVSLADNSSNSDLVSSDDCVVLESQSHNSLNTVISEVLDNSPPSAIENSNPVNVLPTVVFEALKKIDFDAIKKVTEQTSPIGSTNTCDGFKSNINDCAYSTELFEGLDQNTSHQKYPGKYEEQAIPRDGVIQNTRTTKIKVEETAEDDECLIINEIHHEKNSSKSGNSIESLQMPIKPEYANYNIEHSGLNSITRPKSNICEASPEQSVKSSLCKLDSGDTKVVSDKIATIPSDKTLGSVKNELYSQESYVSRSLTDDPQKFKMMNADAIKKIFIEEHRKYVQIRQTEENVSAGLKMLENTQLKKLKTIYSHIKSSANFDTCCDQVANFAQMLQTDFQSNLKCIKQEKSYFSKIKEVSVIELEKSSDSLIKKSEEMAAHSSKGTVSSISENIKKECDSHIKPVIKSENMEDDISIIEIEQSQDIGTSGIPSCSNSNGDQKIRVPQLVPKCAECGKQAVAVCQGCGKVYYCSQDCAEFHWEKIHHDECEVSS